MYLKQSDIGGIHDVHSLEDSNVINFPQTNLKISVIQILEFAAGSGGGGCGIVSLLLNLKGYAKDL